MAGTRRKTTSQRQRIDSAMGYVALVGGPLAGRWYYATHWAQARRAAERMGYPPGHPSGHCLAYHDAGREIDHPHRDDPKRPDFATMRGQVWAYRRPEPGPAA